MAGTKAALIPIGSTVETNAGYLHDAADPASAPAMHHHRTPPPCWQAQTTARALATMKKQSAFSVYGIIEMR
jgi:hypothetical protein